MMYNERIYVWLQSCFHHAGTKAAAAIHHFGSVSKWVGAVETDLRLSGLFTDRELFLLIKKDLSAADQVIDRCFKLGIDILTPENPRYPALLRQIPNYPLVLYVRGDLSDFDENPAVAIVGTRNATPGGVAFVQTLAADLAKAGMQIVSGGALGIDTAAHAGAVLAGGKTVMVAGCGLNMDYPKPNRALKQLIAAHGAVISEFPPDTQPNKFTFPIRNRIISGLSLGVIVAEAGEVSGSLITASRALEQNRDVFAVKLEENRSYYRGAKKLLDDGAIPVWTSADVLREYIHLFPHKLRLETQFPKREVNRKKPEAENKEKRAVKAVSSEPIPEEPETPVSDHARAILAAVNGENGLDEICESAGLSAGEVNCGLTELEMAGLIIRETAQSKFTKHPALRS